MTCEECQRLAIDLARGLPPFDVGGAVQRADVLSHAAACTRCSQWLSVQEALTDALRAAAAADAGLTAPPRVEANVMAAFRARQAHRQPAFANRDHATPAPARAWRSTASFSDQGASSFQRLGGRAAAFAAAAAVIIAALTMASWRWLNPSPVVERGAGSAAAGTAAAAAPAVASPAVTSPPVTSPAVTSPAVTGTNAAVIEVLPDKGKKATKGRPAPPRVVATRAARREPELSGPAFVLLPYVEPLRPTEMRHIMRVRMTRAQLEAGELRASGIEDSTVLADVLVGEDGTARAVRIVQ